MDTTYELKYSKERYHADIKEILYLSCEYGIERINPDYSNSQEMEIFMREVHNGWKLAQSRIKDISLEVINEIRELESLLKDSRRKREKSKCLHYEECLNILKYRLKSIFKIIDGMIWAIYRQEEHYLRRLYSGREEFHINKKDIDDLFEVIDHINSDENQIAIAFDLSTFAHIGDYIHINTAESKCTIVELKTGERNLKILESIGNFHQHKCMRRFFFEAEVKSKKDIKQIERMARQEMRASNLMNIVQNDEGEDYSTGLHIRLSKEAVEVGTFTDTLVGMFYELSPEKTWSVGAVDECLFLGMYRRDCIMHPRMVFSKWMEVEGVKSPIIDYRSVFMVNMCHPPSSHHVPLEFVQQIYLDEIFLLMCLDLPLLIEQSRQAGMNIYLGKQKESRRIIAQQKDVPFVTIDGRVIHMETTEGIMTMADGILAKIYYSFQTPLALMKAMCSQKFTGSSPTEEACRKIMED